MINLGNDDNVPGAPACSAIIPLALVTMSKGINFIIIEVVYMGISTKGLVFI